MSLIELRRFPDGRAPRICGIPPSIHHGAVNLSTHVVPSQPFGSISQGLHRN